MSDVAPPRISVVIPIFGNEGDLSRLVKALQGQSLPPYEILLVDGSPDPLEEAPSGTRVVRNKPGSLLGEDYNLGIKAATGEFVLCMQQDCVPKDMDGIERMFAQLTPGRVSVVAMVRLPEDFFRSYNFWGQVLMARWIGCVQQGVSMKFDLHRRDVFAEIGWMETWPPALAGEDMDLCLRLIRKGQVFVSDVEVIHYHHQRSDMSARDVLKRHFRLAESFGALLRKWGGSIRKVPYAGQRSHHAAKYLYLLVPFLFLWPLPVGITLILGSNFTNLHAWRIQSPRRLWLPLFNPCSFFTGFIGTLLGLRHRPIWPPVAGRSNLFKTIEAISTSNERNAGGELRKEMEDGG